MLFISTDDIREALHDWADDIYDRDDVIELTDDDFRGDDSPTLDESDL